MDCCIKCTDHRYQQQSVATSSLFPRIRPCSVISEEAIAGIRDASRATPIPYNQMHPVMRYHHQHHHHLQPAPSHSIYRLNTPSDITPGYNIIGPSRSTASSLSSSSSHSSIPSPSSLSQSPALQSPPTTYHHHHQNSSNTNANERYANYASFPPVPYASAYGNLAGIAAAAEGGYANLSHRLNDMNCYHGVGSYDSGYNRYTTNFGYKRLPPPQASSSPLSLPPNPRGFFPNTSPNFIDYGSNTFSHSEYIENRLRSNRYPPAPHSYLRNGPYESLPLNYSHHPPSYPPTGYNRPYQNYQRYTSIFNPSMKNPYGSSSASPLPPSVPPNDRISNGSEQYLSSDRTNELPTTDSNRANKNNFSSFSRDNCSTPRLPNALVNRSSETKSPSFNGRSNTPALENSSKYAATEYSSVENRRESKAVNNSENDGNCRRHSMSKGLNCSPPTESPIQPFEHTETPSYSSAGYPNSPFNNHSEYFPPTPSTGSFSPHSNYSTHSWTNQYSPKSVRWRSYESATGTATTTPATLSPSSNFVQKNRVLECDFIPSKKSRKKVKTENDDAGNDSPEMREEIRDLTPLPGFQQAFGSTEIGRFSETFFTNFDNSPSFDYYPYESDNTQSPKPWETGDSLEGPHYNLHIGAKVVQPDSCSDNLNSTNDSYLREDNNNKYFSEINCTSC